jgi:RNA polymerase sigma-70 factor (ECF subfamily)
LASPLFQPEPSADFTRWLAQARGGSPDALGRLLEECRQYLLLIANEELPEDLRPKVGASDLVQETFLRAQAHLAQFRGKTPEELFVWLRRILLNYLANCGRHYRETAKRQLNRECGLTDTPLGQLRELFASATESPPVRLAAIEEADEVDRALTQLPEHYRQAIHLRNRDDLPFEEIGRLMGRSEEAARKLWVRAIEQLQELLELHHGRC